MKPRKREPAKWIFSKELKDTTIIEEKPDAEPGKPYIVTPLGTRVKRVLIAGTVTQKNSEDNLSKVTVTDGAGSFYISAFANEFNVEQKQDIDALEINDVVVIMGKINPFKTSDDVFYFNINPELVSKIDKEARDLWILRSSYLARRKLYAIRELMKSEGGDKENLTKLGYTDEEADCAIRAKESYSDYDFQKYEEIVTSVIGTLNLSETATKSKDMILDYIKNNDTDGKGCRYEDILIAASNASIDQTSVDEILNTLGSEGEIYEVSLKKYKAL